MISSRDFRTATSNTDVAFWMTKGGQVVWRAKLNFGRERQDLRRVVCNWEISRSLNRPRALWIFPTLSSTEDSQNQLEPRRQKPELVTVDVGLSVVGESMTITLSWARFPPSGSWSRALPSIHTLLYSPVVLVMHNKPLQSSVNNISSDMKVLV